MTESIEHLPNLLLVGVVFVTGHPKPPCPGETAPDGWNWPPSTWFRLTNLSVPLREVRYLYDTKAIRVTCISTPVRQLLALRIYLVPEELRIKTLPRHQYSFAIQHMDDKRKAALNRLIPYFYIPGLPTHIVPFYKTSLPGRVAPSEERLNGWLKHLCNDPRKKTSTREELESGKNLLMSLYESVDFEPQYDITDPYVDNVFSGHIDNLESELYPYQAETVAQMMHMEENPRTAVSARYLSIKGFYFHPEDLVARKELPETTGLSRGGILAENMGLGKTCICLALICATRKSMATVPVQYSDTLTETMMELPDNGKIPQLKVLVAKKVAELGAPWGLYKDRLSPSCVAVLSSIRCTFLMPDIPRVRVSSRTAAAREQKPPRRIHLSAATLLVCPDSLPFQWLTETKKHTENLKVVLVTSVEKAPDLDTVLDADLVIITNSVLKDVFSSSSCAHIQDIRWKRLIVDEGHVVGNNNSILDICGQEWIAECRWVVSGTPTAGLTRLDTKTLFDHKADLQKLGRIMGEFLKIEPWCDNANAWQQSVVKPLLSGRYDGFEHAVRVLSGVLVRHQIADVERSTRLPPLYNDVVFLEPSFYDRIIANLYVSNISLLNVVDEKKFGLNNLVRRIRGAAMTSTHYETRDIQYFLDTLSTYIHENREGLTGEGREKGAQLVKKIFSALNYAATSGNWLRIAGTQEMPFFVEDKTRTVLPFQIADSIVFRGQREYGIVGGSQLSYLQKAAGTDSKLNLWTETKSKDGTPLEGVMEELSDDPLFSNRFWKTYNRAADTKRKRWEKLHPAPKHFHHARQKVSPQSYLESVGLPFDAAHRGQAQKHHPQLDMDVSVSRPSIVGTGSAKLSYLVSKTLSLVDKHKIIVFYEDMDSGYVVSEAFEAAGIKHLIYTTDKVSKERRAQYLATFEATDNFQVLLMNINAAAHGLNITSASWVFFLSPVWRRDIEAQAIKRAHRIGQKSEVHVETLVLKDTLEEEIYRRRTEISDADAETPKDMADDDQLRETILNYALTSMESLHKGTTDEIAFFDEPVPLYNETETHEQFENALVYFEGLPQKKKRKKKVVADGFEPSKKKPRPEPQDKIEHS
ncbi:putative ATP-dependent helicase C23E6.02 [Yarrowia sp. B02]|nr:putative ATP-dependent helicase C23E6.02 [Yarrowia sp. B02]